MYANTILSEERDKSFKDTVVRFFFFFGFTCICDENTEFQYQHYFFLILNRGLGAHRTV